MSELLAHPKTRQDLESIITAPNACYLLIGQKGSGKLGAAQYIASHLTSSILDRIHVLPNDKNKITIEMAHELIKQLNKHTSAPNGYRVVIVQSAESMTVPAQNALLKIIEEPPARTTFLLLTQNSYGVLATIQSRCQNVYIRQTSESFEHPEVQRLARGRVGLASAMLNDPQTLSSQKDIMARAQAILSATPLERIALAEELATDQVRDQIIEELAYEVSAAARKQKATSQVLQSMQNYFIYSNAGVASKHALTEMMIRL